MTIKLDGKEVVSHTFPDGTLHLKLDFDKVVWGRKKIITWLYQPNEEMILFNLVKHIIDNDKNSEIYLEMPYIPNARMDRTESYDDVFTLKHFCNFINSLDFDGVAVMDPHSIVSLALLNNVYTMDSTLKNFQSNAVELSKADVIFFPDAGASKRYAKNEVFSDYPSTYGDKVRDWRTGIISSLKIANESIVKGKNILIVDDICSYGGTFVKSIAALEKAGANEISLAVTHCENNIEKGELLSQESLEKVYTTNSIYTGTNTKVDVISKF